MTLKPKIWVFSDFLQISAAEEWIAKRWMERERPRLFANWNCYRLSRVSWALAQISCRVRIRIWLRVTVSSQNSKLEPRRFLSRPLSCIGFGPLLRVLVCCLSICLFVSNGVFTRSSKRPASFQQMYSKYTC